MPKASELIATGHQIIGDLGRMTELMKTISAKTVQMVEIAVEIEPSETFAEVEIISKGKPATIIGKLIMVIKPSFDQDPAVYTQHGRLGTLMLHETPGMWHVHLVDSESILLRSDHHTTLTQAMMYITNYLISMDQVKYTIQVLP